MMTACQYVHGYETIDKVCGNIDVVLQSTTPTTTITTTTTTVTTTTTPTSTITSPDVSCRDQRQCLPSQLCEKGMCIDFGK